MPAHMGPPIGRETLITVVSGVALGVVYYFASILRGKVPLWFSIDCTCHSNGVVGLVDGPVYLAIGEERASGLSRGILTDP